MTSRCPNCGGAILGDGFTLPYHCERVTVTHREPDAPVLYCSSDELPSSGTAMSQCSCTGVCALALGGTLAKDVTCSVRRIEDVLREEAAATFVPQPPMPLSTFVNQPPTPLAEGDMTAERRWKLTQKPDEAPPLTKEEREAGWHFCPEWDMLLCAPRFTDEQCTCEVPGNAETLVSCEFMNQLNKWGTKHDDARDNESLAMAAAALLDGTVVVHGDPWQLLKGRENNRLEQLVIAAALVHSEIERRLRAMARAAAPAREL